MLMALALTTVPGFGGLEAQSIPSPYRLIDATHATGVIVGVMSENRGELGMGPRGGTFFGGRYALEFQGPFALEVTGFVMPTDRAVIRMTSGDEPVPIGKSDMMIAGIDGRLRFTLTGDRTWHGFAPLLMLGGGLVGNLSAVSGPDLELAPPERFMFGPSFLGVMGGGIRWIPGERLEFRVDTTLTIWKLNTPVGLLDIEREAGKLPNQEWTGVSALVLGATFRP
jgi:hypothetical protein